MILSFTKHHQRRKHIVQNVLKMSCHLISYLQNPIRILITDVPKYLQSFFFASCKQQLFRFIDAQDYLNDAIGKLKDLA